MPTENYLLGSQTTLLSTGLDALADNALALSAAYDNTAGAAGDGSTLCDLELVVSYASAPDAGSAVVVWLLASQDGTNYEDGGTSVTPLRIPDRAFPLRPVTGAQRIIRRVAMPPGLFKALLKNDATGEAMAASGNTLKIRAVTFQSV